MATKGDKLVEPPIAQKSDYAFQKLASALLCVMIVLLSGSWYYDSSSKSSSTDKETTPYAWYPAYMDITTFTLVVFGFCMVFLKKYAFTSLSMALLTVSISIPLGLTASEIISFVMDENESRIGGNELSEGLFASITVLISLGVILGRINHSQLLCTVVMEIIFWGINIHLNETIWGLHDVGFSINIHLFATYFGLAISFMIEPAINDEDNKSMYHSDIFSMIGTLFLWLYWPSLNGYLAETEYYYKDRAIVNTVLSLCGSTFAAFFMSLLLSKDNKFNITHIQQSALAGGVAIGTAADLYVHPVGAIAVGIVSGIVSVLGYVYLSNEMEKILKIADTRGIHNVHGLPAILGGFVAAIALAVASAIDGVYVDANHPDYPFVWNSLQLQSIYTIVAMCSTLLIAIFGGGLTGWILVLFKFPNYEFKDIDNFNVFSEYEREDPFRETIRGRYFGLKKQCISGDYNMVRNDTLMGGDFDWRYGNDAPHAGIQVVDSMVAAVGIDASDWRKYIEMDIVPHIKSISYANILSDYYFDDDSDADDDDDDGEEDEMFYPSVHTAKVVKQSFIDNDDDDDDEKYEYYITAKLKSNVDPYSFKRKCLNLVIVLDVAGSMCADFEHEIGDNKEGNKNLEMANMMSCMITKHLTSSDRIGLVALAGKVRVLQTLQFVNSIDMEHLRKEIIFLQDVATYSKTTSSDAYKKGVDLFHKASVEYDEEYENRIIFITVGLSGDDGSAAEQCANDEDMRIYTTIIGIGIGLTSELDKRWRFRGFNMVNVQRMSELKQYFDDMDKFTFLVTPIFYNINLKLKCLQNSCKMDAIYGCKNERYTKYVMKRGNIMKIHTTFASNDEIKIVQSGILLIKLKPIHEDTAMNATIVVSYEDRNESEYFNEKSITFKDQVYCDSHSIRKSILLCKYAQILIKWIDSTNNENERLMVTTKYKQIFSTFAKYFQTEMIHCNDRTLQRELDILHKLANA